MFKQKSDSPPATPRSEPVDAVQQARARARNRLIGAIVLLAIGIIGFPLVFETQPRPIPVDIPIEIPRRDAMPPLAMPSAPAQQAASASVEAMRSSSSATARAASAAARPIAAASKPVSRRADAMITESPAEAGRDVTPPRAAVAPAAASVTSAPPTRTNDASQRPDGDGERARALLEGRPAVAAEGQRFVVQVGAFADAEAARETRKQVEKLGLKTYTQVAQTASGSRIRVRVGPFTTRAEADAAVAKVKAASLAAVVLTL